MLGVVAGVGLLVAFATAQGSSRFLTHGGSALVAVLSVVLVLVAAGGWGPVARLLGTAPLVALGRLSYSIYLWHIPVIAVLSPQRTGWAGWRLTFVRLLVTAAASVASFALLERPIRHSAAPARRLVPAFGLTTVVCAAAAVLMVPSTQPVLSAAGADGYDPDPAALPRVEPSPTTAFPTPPTAAATPTTTAAPTPTTTAAGPETTTAPEPTSPPTTTAASLRKARRLLVVGDSVAWSLESQLRRASTGRISVTNRGTIGCNIWKGEAVMLQGRRTEDHPACQEWPARWSSLLSSVRPDVAMLVLGTSGGDRLIEGAVSGECDGPFRSAFRAHVTEAIDVLGSQGAMVVVTTVSPRSSDPDPDAPRRAGCLNEELRAAVAERPVQSELVDLAGLVCPDGGCLTEHEGALVRPDGLHFGSRGTPWVGRWLLDEILEPGRLARHGLTP